MHSAQFEVIWPFVRTGAISRSKLSAGTSKYIKSFLKEDVFDTYYNRSINESELNKIIEKVEQRLKSIHRGKTNCFGNAQKMVNLTLKSMWICNWLKGTPPHFPVDRIIQQAIEGKIIPWTDMSKTEYETIIKAKKKNFMTGEYVSLNIDELALWELNAYSLLTKEK